MLYYLTRLTIRCNPLYLRSHLSIRCNSRDGGHAQLLIYLHWTTWAKTEAKASAYILMLIQIIILKFILNKIIFVFYVSILFFHIIIIILGQDLFSLDLF